MATMVTGTSAAPSSADVPASTGPREPLRARVVGVLVRLRLALVCSGFLVLALLQQPGRIIGDTKLDLAVDPLSFLGRALTLWEPVGAAGQLQNQAYGYFFPMGPFFALGQLAGLPVWVVQRLWWAALMSVAFLGVVVLARRLRIGTPATALVAGIAYALAPRMLTAIGTTSVELIPMALAPWVLIPLVGAEERGSARRAAALSGLAVFCVGGVNAVATAAVLPLAVLYLLTRPAGPFRRRLVVWWGICVGLASVWWAGPLVLLGRFSPPFLFYIENADATTGPTDVLSVLRGTSHWVATLASPSGPTWPAGWSLVHDVVPVAGTVLLAAAGLAALCRRDLPERTWLVLGVLAGVGLVSLGHLAEVQGLWADRLHDGLDDFLAPLRNVHKFDPVLRLPLVLGLAHLGAVLLARARRGRAGQPDSGRLRSAARIGSRATLGLLVLALVAGIVPALAGRLAPPNGFTEIPGYWRQTAAFLEDQQPSGRALVLPGSSFPTYEWGSPTDEPLQALADSPWDVRNAIPLTPEGHIRMLDAVESRLEQGEGAAGLSRYLARAGISHLVLRNDVDTGATGATRSVLVRQALRDSPGISPVGSFGPVSEADGLSDGRVLDSGLDEPAPPIEIYAVADPAPRAWTTPMSSAVGVHGGPEALLPLEDRGVITDRPAMMAGSTAAPTDPAMVTDALLRRERTFGRLADAASGGLSEDDPLRLDAPVRDYVLPNLALAESVIRYIGGTPSASSSASDPDGFNGTRMDTQPWSAVDVDPMTAWRPAPWDESSEPPWWRLTTERQFLGREIVVSLGEEPGVARPSELKITTDAGELVVPVADTGEEQVLPIPQGYTSQLTISSTVPANDPDAPALALAEVRVLGINVHRSAVTPVPEHGATVFSFDAERGRSGCVTGSEGTPLCTPALITGSEEAVWLDRTFSVPGWSDYDIFGTAVARPGLALDALLTEARGTPLVEASSSPVSDPRGSAIAAVDGDPNTAWLAAGDDRRPTLTLTWPEPRTVDSLRVVTDPGLVAARPTAVTIDAGGLPRSLRLTEDGSVQFAPVVTDRLAVTFELPEELESLDPFTRWDQRLGVGVSELEVGGPNPVTPSDTPVRVEPGNAFRDPDTAELFDPETGELACGSGPDVQVDGAVMLTRARPTVGTLETLRPTTLEFCDAVPSMLIPGGEHRLLARSSEILGTDSVTLQRAGSPSDIDPGIRTAAGISRWDAEHRAVEVDAGDGDTLLVIPENINPGWTATLDGQTLTPVTIDGWQQGYIVPAGSAGTVQLDFTPGPAYRTALAVGAGAVLLLVLVAAWPARPLRDRPRRAPRVAAALSAVFGTAFVVGSALFGTALVGGLAGLAALAVLWLLRQITGRWGPAVLGAVATGALLAAGATLVSEPDGSTPGQLLAVVALSAVVAGILPVVPVRRLLLRRTPRPPRTATAGG
ncbi:alpha-(1-_3)-arabinofuranosyltransferase [Candidatus Blastococcus massiliensis]|uniref:alpha-(1->3)-arabinofuranosyltransferase n=1 Tax=Candidatus Blastococcus massiliensis TaxID=1470358 RepID=UPI0004BB512C|nr:alpha-(1->3)-arabinofuranosyltransferase [Candidatus Blastococcus massiliensis]